MLIYRNAECRYAECPNAECRDANRSALALLKKSQDKSEKLVRVKHSSYLDE